MVFSEALQLIMDQWVKKYPVKQSALIPILLEVQAEHQGWLSQACMDHVAAYLELPPVKVYEVVTFYTMFHRKPVGKNHIKLCTNVGCMLHHAKELSCFLKNYLQIDFGETTKDGLFSLTEVECLGGCVKPSVALINDRYVDDLDVPKMKQLIQDLKE